ncbi:unnamed protein product [Auanema sp. JU1783]|nr:unnamed protein product [Auanema sp. JU1783]
MDRGQFIEIGNFDETSVDCSIAPQSAEQYLQQVMVSRNKCPQVVRVNVDVEKQNDPVPERKKTPDDSKRQNYEWQKSKADDFSIKRAQYWEMKPTVKKLQMKYPSPDSEEKWRDLILEKCHPALSSKLSQFPNHICTPPALSLICGLNSPQVNALISYIVEWANTESLTRPLREWLFALMIAVELPLLHDVVASLRDLAKMCKALRAEIDSEKLDEISEISYFVAIVGVFFEQKDLID